MSINRSPNVLALCLALLSGLLLFVPGARADVIGLSPYSVNQIAVGTGSTTGFWATEYNPVTDTWLGVDSSGLDYINQADRGGSVQTVANGFGLGGIAHDELAVAHNNFAWVIEGHARSIYKLVPATVGASKTLVGQAPGDSNGSSWAEWEVSEADANGDLIAGFGPATAQTGTPSHAPRDWFRVTQAGSISPLFATTNSIITWLKRDPWTGAFYGIDNYDPNDSGSQPYWNASKPSLVTIDINTGAISTIQSYSSSLVDIEVDRTQHLTGADVIWAILDNSAIVPLDPLTGILGAPIVTATDNWLINGLALAPSSDNPSRSSLYFSTYDVSGSTARHRLHEVFIPAPAAFGLGLVGLAGLIRRR